MTLPRLNGNARPAGREPLVRPARRPATDRFWEIDLLRGVAIVMMVIFHLMWDLSYFQVLEVDVYAGFWRGFQRATASLFLLVVGVSLHVSTMQRRQAGAADRALFRHLARRGLRIFLWGMVITAVTWVLIRDAFVVFGILHLIGVSVAIAAPFLRLGGWNAALALPLILAGNAVQGVRVGLPWLVWLGLVPVGFASVDYFPLLPWFGVVLLGIAVGSVAYDHAGRRFALPPLGDRPPIRLLRLLGRHSLPIYLLHQPVLLAGLLLTGLVDSRMLF